MRASKLFEWNMLNPNSNEAKRQAALQRQINGTTDSPLPTTATNVTSSSMNINGKPSSRSRGSKSAQAATAAANAAAAAAAAAAAQAAAEQAEAAEIAAAAAAAAAAATVVKSEKRSVRHQKTAANRKMITADDHYGKLFNRLRSLI